jgi:tetratricopeptide (TPR) repeat protein
LAKRSLPPPGRDTGTFVDFLTGHEPTRPDPRPPPTIEGLEQLVEVGRGGMGVVYRARDVRLGRDVAVKVLSASAAVSPEGRSRAEREARLLARIVHPNIVRIHAVTEAEGLPAIVMEWIDGVSLEARYRLESIAVAEAAHIVRDMARAVAEVHAAGIIHRDIKPANVLLARVPGGGASLPKLIDFGLARPDSGTTGTVTRSSAAVGTPSFMAPEQTGLVPSLGSVGPPTDIHALGGLLYWLLSGRAPYDGRTTLDALHRAAHGDVPPLSLLVPRLPADMATIVATCLEHRPEHRYRSSAALADDLDRFLEGRPILARRAGIAERVVKWARRHPATAGLVASVAIGVLALLAGGVYHVVHLRRAHQAMTAKRDEALASEELARRSFDQLTDTTAERFIARGNALDEADRDHLRRIASQYRAWPLGPDPAAGLRYRAAGLRRLMDLFLRLSWSDDALDSARGALESLAELAASGGATAEDERFRLDFEGHALGILVSTGRLDEAAMAATAAIERLDLALESKPELARFLPGSWAALARVETLRGRQVEADRFLHLAVDRADRLLAESPDDVEILRLMLPVYINTAWISSDWAIDDRAALFGKVADRALDGLNRFDVDREMLGTSAIAGLTGLAEVDLEAGRPDSALEQVRRRALLVRELAAEMPDSEQLAAEALLVAKHAARCLMALGRPADAEEELTEAVKHAEDAVTAEPAIASRTRVLVWLLEARAEIEIATGRRPAAIATERRLLDLLRRWNAHEGAANEFRSSAERAQAALDRLLAEDDAAAGPLDPAAAAPSPMR